VQRGFDLQYTAVPHYPPLDHYDLSIGGPPTPSETLFYGNEVSLSFIPRTAEGFALPQTIEGNGVVDVSLDASAASVGGLRVQRNGQYVGGKQARHSAFSGIDQVGVPEIGGDRLSYAMDVGEPPEEPVPATITVQRSDGAGQTVHPVTVRAYIQVSAYPEVLTPADTSFLDLVAFDRDAPDFDGKRTLIITTDKPEVGRLALLEFRQNRWQVAFQGSPIHVPYFAADSAFAVPEGSPLPFPFRVGYIAWEQAADSVETVTIRVEGIGWDNSNKRGQGRVTVVVPTVTLLSQDDTPYQATLPAEDKYLMVSKFRTNFRLPGSVGFSTTYSTADADTATFRPQVTGIPQGKTVQFRVRVTRNGQDVKFRASDGQATDAAGQEYYEFDAVGDLLADGMYAYRGTQHIRLVSNAPPEDARDIPRRATYDDEYRDQQTIRVELEDSVHVSLVIDGQETSRVIHRPVGRPAAEDGPDAIRRVELNWHTYIDKSGASPDTLDSVPETITARMSEDWAQASVYFENLAESHFDADQMRNVFYIRTRDDTTLVAGTVTIEVTMDGTTRTIVLNHQQGHSAHVVAVDLAAQIRSALGLPGLSVAAISGQTLSERTSTVVPHTYTRRMYIVVGRGLDIVVETTFTSGGLFAGPVDFRYFIECTLETHQMGAIATNFVDFSTETVDVFVVPNNVLHDETGVNPRIWGKGIPNSRAGVDATNTMFLVENAADRNDSRPLVAGHEVGHVMGLSHPSQDSTNFIGIIPPAEWPENLMYRFTPLVERYDAAKRLRTRQQKHIRRKPSNPVLKARGKTEQ